MARGLHELVGNLVIGVELTKASFTIELPDEHADRLRELAEKLGTTPEQALTPPGVQEWLTTSSSNYNRTAFYVLKKNAELYRRLA